RACFAGDSWFVIKELTPEENWIEHWPSFCGHIFALTSFMHNMEKTIENPGIRLIISYGTLLQLSRPDRWREEHIEKFTKNWFVLTGASKALRKCTVAEAGGKKSGFDGGYCWHEDPQKEQRYLGTPFFHLPRELYQDPSLYPEFYKNL